ncbi:unnamed protein product, partial [Mesorhabditis spiculigera]
MEKLLEDPGVVDESKLCKVCQAASDGSHFGVESCRACAAFFRRSVVLSKDYICRQQGGMCKIYKGTRMCRKCRMDKCRRLGMISDQVQNRPAEKETFLECSPTSSTTPDPVYNISKLSPSQIAPRLYEINDIFKHFLSVQRSVEHSVTNATHRDVFDTVIQKVERPMANFPMMCRLARAILPCVIEFVKSVLAPLPELQPDELWHIYRQYSPMLWMFETSYFTYKYMEPDSTTMMFTQTTIVDLNNTRYFYEGSVAEHNVETMSNVMRECYLRDCDAVRQLRSLEPTEIEISALMVILLWDQNVAREKPALIQIASEQRDIIFNELSQYYRYVLNLPDYAVRLGKLMCIYSSLQNNASNFKEELELFNMMNLSDGNHFGVEACRACAAFFRRCITLPKPYNCTQKSNRCRIHKGTRICRKCRLDKCRRLGMATESVQNRPAEQESLPETAEEPKQTAEKISTIQPSAPKLPDSSSKEVPAYLTGLVEKFRHYLSVQKAVEYSITEGSQRDLFDTITGKAKKRLAKFNTVCRMARSQLSCTVDYVHSVWPNGMKLEQEELWHHCKAFMPTFWMLGCAYYTYKEMEPGSRLIMFTQTLVMDLDNIRHFYEGAVPEHNVATMANVMQESMLRQLHVVGRMRELKVTEVEIAALTTLLLWDADAARNHPNIQKIGAGERKKIFDELGRYYRFVLNESDYAARLGGLMCLYSSFQGNAFHFKEELELFNMMNLFKQDTFIYDFLKH